MLTIALALSLLLFPQKPTADQRVTLEQILTQTYQPSDVGKHLMGIGAESDVHRPGIIVVIQHDGLYGSLDRKEIASYAVHGLKADMYRGHNDYAVPVGERFYVTSIHVGPSAVNMGLLSTRTVNTPDGTGRVWTSIAFNFPEDVLANADRDTVIRGIDPWFVPEGRNAVTPAAYAPQPASTVAAQPAPAAAAPAAIAAAPLPAVSPSAAANLAPGMSADQITAALGQPTLKFTNGSAALWQYPGLIAKFENNKLVSVDPQLSSTSATVTLNSNPDGAEIYLDNQLVGSTPSTLQISPGDHQLTLKLPNHPDWSRQLHILPASQIHFSPKL